MSNKEEILLYCDRNDEVDLKIITNFLQDDLHGDPRVVSVVLKKLNGM